MRRRSFVAFGLLAIVLCIGAPTFGEQDASSTPASVPAQSARTKRVLIISVDGLRPDVLLRAKAPTMRGLMDKGSFTMWAMTTPMAITLPSHTSMLTGATVPVHGIEWTSDKAPGKPAYPKLPTVLELAHSKEMVTALASGKSKFAALAKPGTLTASFVPPSPDGMVKDAETAKQAAAIIRKHRPAAMFVHFADVDTIGHSIGWGTTEQLAAVERADAAITVVLDAYKSEGVLEDTLIIISADHGGAGKTHGPDDPRSRHIPWIASGPGVRENFDLTRDRDLVVNTEDTAATACQFLGLAPGDGATGKPVMRIYRELPGASQ